MALVAVLLALELISRTGTETEGDPAVVTGRPGSVAVPDTPRSSLNPLAESENEPRSDRNTRDSPDASSELAPTRDSGSQAAPEPLISAAAGPDSQQASGAGPDWEQLAQSVVQLIAPDCEQAGSGTIIGDGLLVVTNSHVLHAGGDGPLCVVYAGFTRRFDESPDDWQIAELVADDPSRDLAVVRLASAPTGAHRPLQVEQGELALGDQLTILGYPGFGDTQDTLTFTSGRFSGTTSSAEGFQMFKTDALLDSGVSGGAAFDQRGRLVGVATGGYQGEGGTLGAVIPGTDVLRFLAEHGLRAEVGSATSEETRASATATLPTVTFPEASVRDPEVEAADLERRRSVIGLFERLRVESEHRRGYDRDAVFSGWLYRSGESTRQRVLAEERRADDSWLSAYDAVVVTSGSELDIDHLVPLAEAWESGGHAWSSEKWVLYSNDLGDPRSLIAVSASTNRSKGARDPAEWWPPSSSYRCQYAADWIAVKARWDLAVDSAEQASLDAQLGQCTGADFDFAEPVPARVQQEPSLAE